MKRFFWGVLAGVGLLAAVVVVRAMMLPSQQVEVAPAPAYEVDANRVAQRLGLALRYRTISHRDRSRFDLRAFQELTRLLESLYRGTHRTLECNSKLAESVQLMADLGQNLFEPPTVKGWEGGRLWINSATMLQRANFAAKMSSKEVMGTVSLSASGTDTVDHYLDLLLGGAVSESAREELHTHFRKSTRKSKGRNANGLLQLILSMPEYQLI